MSTQPIPAKSHRNEISVISHWPKYAFQIQIAEDSERRKRLHSGVRWCNEVVLLRQALKDVTFPQTAGALYKHAGRITKVFTFDTKNLGY